MKTCAFTGHPQITLECAIPYERQAVRWPEALRNRYFSIAERCDQETMLQRQSQWDGTDGVVCQRDWETGLDYSAGYIGSVIKGVPLRWQRGFFLILPKHLSVSFADSRTVAAKRFPVPGGPANRAASSKPARFFRRWRRVAGFPSRGAF